MLELDDDLPNNCIVLIDDKNNSVLKFILGFIAFKQPNFERTQVFCRDLKKLHLELPLFVQQPPSVQNFDFFEKLQESDFDTILTRDSL